MYVSPSDPTFWLHHGGIDRHWWIWQNQDPANRVQQYEGGTTWFVADSPAGKLSDVQDLSILQPAGTVGKASSELVSSTAGGFCYVYV